MSRPRLLAVGAVWALSGCVYYNAVYNADRLADDARRAEREGRPFEAQNLWGRAAVKADSIVARHPGSKWYDDALVIRAEAYAGSGQCAGKELQLYEAIDRAQTADLKERASLAVARCYLALGDATRALPLLTAITTGKNQGRRETAMLMRGMALRQRGQDSAAAEALAPLAGHDARRERMLALAAAGQADSALALARRFLQTRGAAFGWDSLLAVLGLRSPAQASRWLDTLRAAGAVPADRLAPLLAEDAARLRHAEPELATYRLRELAAIVGTTPAGEQARVQLLAGAIGRARTRDELLSVSDSLQVLVGASGMQSPAFALDRMVGRVLQLTDSSSTGEPAPDLRRFIAAELARDSLGALPLAAAFFASVAEEWPESPYAGKALLAARDLDDRWAAHATSLLEGRFASNPYVLLLAGGDPAPVMQLEDSLATFARLLNPAETTRDPAGRPRVGRPPTDPRRGARSGAPIE